MKAGTSLFMAPEVLISTTYDNKCDVYSFGIIMFQVLTQIDDDDIYPKEKLDGKNLDFKIITDKNFRPEIPKIYLNDKKYESYIGYFFLIF
jgi:serine/threonine protein kinase